MKSHPETSRGLCGGVWWCLLCHAPAQLEDPGEAYPRCTGCGHRKCEWRSSRTASMETAEVSVLEEAPIDATPMLNVRRLPRAERPTLSQMTYEGYWRCQACEQPTKRDDQECCVLCGSSQVEFQPPTVTEKT